MIILIRFEGSTWERGCIEVLGFKGEPLARDMFQKA